MSTVALDRLAGAKHHPRQFDVDPSRRTAGDLFQRPDVGRGVPYAGDDGEFGLLVHIKSAALHDKTA